MYFEADKYKEEYRYTEAKERFKRMQAFGRGFQERYLIKLRKRRVQTIWGVTCLAFAVPASGSVCSFRSVVGVGLQCTYGPILASQTRSRLAFLRKASPSVVRSAGERRLLRSEVRRYQRDRLAARTSGQGKRNDPKFRVAMPESPPACVEMDAC